MNNLMELGLQHIGSMSEWGHGFVIDRASRTAFIDTNGREYIDFMSGWNVANVGWNREEVKKAIMNQLEKTAYSPLWCLTEPTVRLAQKLVDLTPRHLDVSFRATGGTEANEIAVLLARAYTGREKVLSFEKEFHGQTTFGSLSLGSTPEATARFQPLLQGFVRLPIPACFLDPCEDLATCRNRCFAELENYLNKRDVAAIFTEAIMTCPGVYKPGDTFFPELRRLCDETGTLLIIDEVGTGFGRTGKMFAIDHFDFVPDIMTFAKALGGGYVPIGATITRKEIADSLKGTMLSSTFGWTPLACAAALANLEIIEQENLCERAVEMGLYIKNQLRLLLRKNRLVGGIRGVGLELAIDVINENREPWFDGAVKIVSLCEEKGLVVELSVTACAVLLMPPLVIELKDVEKGLEILVKAFDTLEESR